MFSPGSAETLARGGGISNNLLIAYSLSNISAKNYQNRLMCVEVIVCYIIVVFLRHSVLLLLLQAASGNGAGESEGADDPQYSSLFTKLVA